jgi:hypothetical protein
MASRERLIRMLEEMVIEGEYYEKYLDYYWNRPERLESDIKKIRRVLDEIHRTSIYRSNRLNLGAGALGSMVSDLFVAATKVAEELLAMAEDDLKRYYETGTLEM